MANTSATGGPLEAQDPTPPDGDDLADIFQDLFAGIMVGIPVDLIRPRWQATPPNQPPKSTTWCAFGVTSQLIDDGPSLYSDEIDVYHYERGEELNVVVSFYGPYAMHFAAILRDGLAVPQNTDSLLQYGMRFASVQGAILTVPALNNTNWVDGRDLHLLFRRKVDRTYAVQMFQASDVHLIDDTGAVDRLIPVPPPEP